MESNVALTVAEKEKLNSKIIGANEELNYLRKSTEILKTQLE